MAQAIQRKLFLTTLLGSALWLPFHAHAQDGETYFYPKHKWVVENVGKDGELPICSISNQLNNGYIVQLAGTKNNLSNLNIDFRQNAFRKNMKYEVQYTIPGQSSTVIPSKAFKESLLVSDLRKNPEFSSQLFDASTIDVDIRGNMFRAYLTGLNASLQRYRECVDPDGHLVAAEQITDAPITDAQERLLSTEPSPIEGAAPPPPVNLTEAVHTAPSETVELTESEKRPDFDARDRYSEELAHKLKEKSKDYQPENVTAPDIYNVAEDTAEDVADDIPQTAQVHDPVHHMVEDTPDTSENQEIAHAEGDHAPLHHPKPKDKYESAIDDVKKTITRKDAIYNIVKPEKPLVADLTSFNNKNDVDKISEHNDERSEHNITNDADKNENAADEEDHQDNHSAAIFPDSYEPAAGAEASPDSISAVDTARDDQDFLIMRNTISGLEKQLAELTSKNRMLSDELKTALQDSEEERLAVSSENWNLEKATMKFNEAERQIMRLGRQLQASRAQCEQEKQKLESMLFDPKLTNQQQLASLASLEAELDEAKSELYRQQRQYEERITLLEQRLNAP